MPWLPSSISATALQFERNDTPEAKLRKLEGALGQYGLALPEMVPLLAALLSLPPPDHYPPLALTPPRQRQKPWKRF